MLRHAVDPLSDQDLGPVHKLLDCARAEPDPRTRLITFDDDMVLDASLAARLVAASDDHPGAAVGFSGWCASPMFLARNPPAFVHLDFVAQHSVRPPPPRRVRNASPVLAWRVPWASTLAPACGTST